MFGHNNSVCSLIYLKKNNVVLSGSSDKTIKYWKVDKAKSLRTLRGHTHFIWSICATEDEEIIISGSWDQSIRIWDFITGNLLHNL